MPPSAETMTTASTSNSAMNSLAPSNKIKAPKSMVDALETDDPYQALLALSESSHLNAQELSSNLRNQLNSFTIELPELLHRVPNLKDVDSHPVSTGIACTDSILQSLSKIASGGSQASQEIKQLEDEKRDLEEHAQDVESALVLRKSSDLASQSLSAQRYEAASQAIAAFLSLKQESKLTERAKQYAGEYTVSQLESTHASLRTTILDQYQEAVEKSDVMVLGKLTPLVQMVQMEQEAVALYVRFLKEILVNDLKKASHSSSDNRPTAPHVSMARVYNTAVTILRHHLPMVSHCLHRADGDAAVVQLVHLQVEQAVSPLFTKYIQAKQLAVSANNAQRIYEALEGKYKSATGHMGDDDLQDDCGFSSLVGSLADVDAAMEEAALCLQHAESYTRFIEHSVKEVNKARAMRFDHQREQVRREKERKEWATGMSGKLAGSSSNDDESDEDFDQDYEPLEILPAHTRLHEDVAEVGGYYSVIERCLLLASMQRAFSSFDEDNMRHYTPLGLPSTSGVTRALQTSMVENCLYAARRGTQRAFATGHTGTASAMANFCSDCLRGVLVDYLSRRAEDIGVASLKPGEGLVAGSGGIFNASNLIRTGQNVGVGASNLIRTGQHVGVGGAKGKGKDPAQRQREIEEGIAAACATFNDLDVAAHHTKELEQLLLQSVERGYPSNSPTTEQLRMCVKGFSPVTEVFQLSATNAIECLVSVMKPRIRALVTDAVGDGSAAGFSTVIGGGNASERHMVRMNYDLDEEAYELLEVSEGYISRLCTCLDDLIAPLCSGLADRLADVLLLEVLGTVSKRLEVSLKKCEYTALGALSLDSDIRDLVNYSKDRLAANEFQSTVALYKACSPLSRLVQISKLLNVDDLEDVLDLINASKRKGTWELSSEDVKSYLFLRKEFEKDRINLLLRLADDD